MRNTPLRPSVAAIHWDTNSEHALGPQEGWPGRTRARATFVPVGPFLLIVPHESAKGESQEAASAMSMTMRAAFSRRYGGPEVVAIETTERPVPGPKDVLIRNHGTTVTSADMRMRSMHVPAGFGLIFRLIMGIRRPRQPLGGSTVSGVIVEVGDQVTDWSVGDRVVSRTGMHRRAHAEYVALGPKAAIARCPDTVSHTDAVSLLFGPGCSRFLMREAGVTEGTRLLIVGAAGDLGAGAVQLAKLEGAHVTAVCSTPNVDLVTSLGADRVIDRQTTDWLAEDETYDVIYDTVGVTPFKPTLDRIVKGGVYLMAVAGLPTMLRTLGPTRGRKVVMADAKDHADDMAHLCELAAQGTITPVIDAIWSFDEISAAHARVDTGRKVGAAVVRIVDEVDGSEDE